MKSVKYLNSAELEWARGEYSVQCWLVLSVGDMLKHFECTTGRPNH